MSEICARFDAAVETLIGDGPIKKRLILAYSENLEAISHSFLPAEAGKTLCRLHEALHSVPPVGRESRIQASVQKMSVAEATGHARTIFGLQRLLAAEPGRRPEILKVVGTDLSEDDALPEFLLSSS